MLKSIEAFLTTLIQRPFNWGLLCLVLIATASSYASEDLPTLTLVDTRAVSCETDTDPNERNCQLRIGINREEDSIYVFKTQIETKKFNYNYFLKNPERFKNVIKIPVADVYEKFAEGNIYSVLPKFDGKDMSVIRLEIDLEDGETIERFATVSNFSTVRFKKKEASVQ